MTTMEAGKRIKAEVRPADGTEVVNAVLSWAQSPEPHTAEIMVGTARRAAENAGYNGWTNYETWAMALWIDNDQGSYETAREIVKQAIATSPTDAYGTERTRAADALKEWMEEQRPEEVAGASVWTDLLSAAFGEVDWFEIAANYAEELGFREVS
jgi:hypothetical protein